MSARLMAMRTTSDSLAGRTVAVTAQRRSCEQVDMLRARGATVVVAPTMQTIDLTGDAELRATTEAVIEAPPEVMVASTGFGVRLWSDTAETWGLREDLVSALGRSEVIARGPKARSACRQLGLAVAWTAPGESMSEVIDHLARRPGIAETRVAVQLFDPDDHPSSAKLRSIAAEVTEIPLYRWELPADTGPADALVDSIIAGEVDAVTFTSQPAIRFLHLIAGDRGGALVAAFNGGTSRPICIGPVCAEAATALGITTSVWPEPFRLVPMIRLLEEKMGRPPS